MISLIIQLVTSIDKISIFSLKDIELNSKIIDSTNEVMNISNTIRGYGDAECGHR